MTVVTEQRSRRATVPDGRTELSPEVTKANRLFCLGCMVCGSWILGPVGAVMMLVALRRLWTAQRAGATIRPWLITIIAGFILLDSSGNFLFWGLDLFPAHDTLIGRTMWENYGRAIDGAYSPMFFHNATALGGSAVPGEKALQVLAMFVVFPMKAAAAWGLLNMRRWGLQWSMIAHWCYLCLWIMYMVNMSAQFPLRFGTSDFGVAGLWFVFLPYVGPVILLPWLHTQDRRLWNG